MKNLIQFICVLSLFSLSAIGQKLPITPDRETTPGAMCNTKNKDYFGKRYKEGIDYCKRNVSHQRKDRIYEDFGIPLHCKTQFTIDHIIPLSLGGDNSNANLWPEHKAVKATRENLEFELFEDLSAGHITQKKAVARIILAKWDPSEEEIEREFSKFKECGNLELSFGTDSELNKGAEYEKWIKKLEQLAD